MRSFAGQKRQLRALVGFGALLGTLAARSAVGAEPAPSPIDWGSCGDAAPGFDCGIIEVPLDYAHPNAGRVQIALGRAPALDPARKLGSVFINPGGPGGSGVATVLNGLGAELQTLLDGRFDVIGFDPRGIAESDGLSCFADDATENAYFSRLPLFPYQREQEQPYFERYAGLAGVCAAAGQPIVSHMSTADVARDLDLLRRAVGDERLTYLGFSYGSFLGETYVNLFPDKVRAVVIDGVLDPRRWTSGLQVLSDGRSQELEFNEFLRLCDEAGPACAFNSPEGAAVRFRSLAARVKTAAVRLPDGTLLSYDVLLGRVVGGLYMPETWGVSGGLAAWLAAAADLSLGQAGAAETYRARSEALDQLLFGEASRALGRASQRDGSLSTVCADAEFPSALADFRANATAAAGALGLESLFWWRNTACSAWPAASSRYAGPWTHPTSAPVLIVGNYFDGITAYADAVATSKLLPGSRLLSYAGWGHTAFDRSRCVRGYVADYLLDGQLPPADTLCPVESNPFAPASAWAVSTPADARSLPRVGRPSPWITGASAP